MGSIEKISLNLSNSLGERLNKTEEEKSVLNYGLFIIIHTSIAIVLTLLVGMITGMVIEIITISVSAAMMKRYSGGTHASSPGRCILVGTLLTCILSYFCKFLLQTVDNKVIILIISIGITFSYFVLYKKCPVPSKNKPMKKESTRKKFRKKAFNLMNLYFIIILLLGIIYAVKDFHVAKTIALSIVLGVVFQTSVLTNIGSSTIGVLDNLFTKMKIG